MLDPELLKKILDAALSHGGDYADVFVERRSPTMVRFDDGKVEEIVTGSESGAGIRLIREGKSSYAFTNDLSAPALQEAASVLGRAMGEGGGEGGERSLSLTVRKAATDLTIKQPPQSVELSRKVKIVREAEAAARGVSAEIRQVSVMYRDSVQLVQIANSLGDVVSDERTHTVALVNVVTERDGVVQTGYEVLGGLKGFELFEEKSLVEAALEAARRAVMMLGARKAPGGRMPVVISSEAGGTMIHEAIGHGLEADLAGQGLSKFTGMLGKQVASKLVTVVDDATLAGLRGSFRFDDEGTPATSNILVKDGVLLSYMYDRLSAMRDGTTSTGNGRRESYQHRPIPRMTNTFITPGGSDPALVLTSTPNGLLVKKMGGGQVNTVTGDFVFDVQEGYLIEDGAQGEPVRGATLTGNGPEVLMAIDMVGSDLGFSIGTCGKDAQGVPVSDAMPTLRIPEMVVGGEV